MRLIDADRLKRKLAQMWYDSPLSITGISVSQLIDEQSTVDAVPVIRCKDCEYWDSSWNTQSPNEHFCAMMDAVVGSMEFCARAERREEDETD